MSTTNRDDILIEPDQLALGADVSSAHESAATWEQVLDSLAIQIDLQETALRFGSVAPSDLEIDPPATPIPASQRIRAIALFERCEELLDLAAARAAGTRNRLRSPYGRHR
jgi:hypothetical protein